VREAQRRRPGDAVGLHLQAPQQPRHQEERERLTRVFGGRLRSEQEIRALFAGAGLALTRTVPTRSTLRLFEGRPT
jgi:hypothetical protein